MTDRHPLQTPEVAPLESHEMEMAVFSACLNDKKCFEKVSFLVPGDFSHPAHQEIWRHMLDLHLRGLVVTPTTVSPLIEGSSEFLKRVCAEFKSLHSSVEGYAEGIRDYASRRRLVDLSETITARARDLGTPGDEVIATTIGDLQKLAGQGVKRSQTKREVGEKIYEDLKTTLPMYSTGIRGLDRSMGGGLFAGKMYAIASRKKVGKTVLLGSVSYNLNLAGVPHLFIALEMSPAELEQRNAARAENFNSVAFLRRDDPSLPNKVAQYVSTQPNNTIYEGAPGATLDEVRSMVGRAISTRNIKGVFLDYLQLVGGKSAKETEEYHLRETAQWLADIARRENIFCVTAAQTNQDGNTRGGEGLRLACDQAYTLHREKDSQDAWLSMDESRYTLYEDVGSDAFPGLFMNKYGPHFTDYT